MSLNLALVLLEAILAGLIVLVWNFIVCPLVPSRQPVTQAFEWMEVWVCVMVVTLLMLADLGEKKP